MAKILYVSYDGVMEPLGHSQVFQYLRHLSKSHEIFLMSFEKPGDWKEAGRREEMLRLTRQAGIHWSPRRYHGRPSLLATAYDVALGFCFGACLVLRHGIGIVHSRSYVPSVLALGLKLTLGTRFLFDMRGFWADERAERSGLSKDSRLYRTAKRFERYFFTRADCVVSLTHAGASAIRDFPYAAQISAKIEVITTCTDLERFRRPASTEKRHFTLGYVGSTDTAYLFEPVLRCFKILRGIKEDARLLVLTRNPEGRLRELLGEFQVDQGCVEIKSVPPDRVAGEMGRMDAGIFFVKPGFSTCASVPTKLGEFLACGVPCLGNSGVGDLESILEGERVGVMVHEFTPEAEERAVSGLVELCGDPLIQARCTEAARRFFSLEDGVRSYDRIYRALTAGEP